MSDRKPVEDCGEARAPAVLIRPAGLDDVDQIYAFIVELAEYERAPEQVTGTPDLLRSALFGSHPSAEALIAELEGVTAGFAVFHGTFSTWECRAGLAAVLHRLAVAHR